MERNALLAGITSLALTLIALTATVHVSSRLWWLQSVFFDSTKRRHQSSPLGSSNWHFIFKGGLSGGIWAQTMSKSWQCALLHSWRKFLDRLYWRWSRMPCVYSFLAFNTNCVYPLLSVECFLQLTKRRRQVVNPGHSIWQFYPQRKVSRATCTKEDFCFKESSHRHLSKRWQRASLHSRSKCLGHLKF